MIESDVTDLPDPDSPTIPSVCPASSWNESPLTAVTGPSSVRNVVRRFRTSSNAIRAVVLDTGQRQDDERDDEHAGDESGQTLELFFRARAALIGRFHAPADRAREALLFGRL